MTDFNVVIPARYGSTRLPGKPLLKIGAQTLIQRVVTQVGESQAKTIVVATDDERIENEVQRCFQNDNRVLTCITASDHNSGTDRISEVVQQLHWSADQIIVNVQGDEPFLPARLIDRLAQCLAQHPSADMATAAQPMCKGEDGADINRVKVVTAIDGSALYFSRSLIPFDRDGSAAALHHIGIYAYRAGFVQWFSATPGASLERHEKLEQLRALEHGKKIMVEVVDYDVGIGIDTEDDIKKAQQRL